MPRQMKIIHCSQCGFGHWVRECPTCGHIENDMTKQQMELKKALITQFYGVLDDTYIQTEIYGVVWDKLLPPMIDDESDEAIDEADKQLTKLADPIYNDICMTLKLCLTDIGRTIR